MGLSGVTTVGTDTRRQSDGQAEWFGDQDDVGFQFDPAAGVGKFTDSAGSSVFEIDPTGGATLAQGDLYFSGGTIVHSDENKSIQFRANADSNGASNPIFFYSEQIGDTVLTVDEGGHIDIHNGHIRDSNQTRVVGIGDATNAVHTKNKSGSAVRIYDTYNAQDIIKAHVGGDVDITSGDLKLGSNQLRKAGGDGTTWRFDTYGNGVQITKAGSGIAEFAIDNGYDMQAGAVRIPNGGSNGTGSVQFANTEIRENSNGEVEVVDSAGNVTVIS